jgi:hypothetical protein
MAPVLCVGAEYDRVAVPEGAILAASLFSNGRHVWIPGATHYFLYDSSEFAARLIEAFFDNPLQFEMRFKDSVEGEPHRTIDNSPTSVNALADAWLATEDRVHE